MTALLAIGVIWWAEPTAAAGRPHATPALAPLAKVIGEPMPDASSPSAEVTFAMPQRFAIVSDPQTKRRRLYGRGDLVPDGRGPEQGLVVEEVETASLRLRDPHTQELVRVAVGKAMPGGGSRRLVETTVLDGVDYCYVRVKGAVDPEPRILQIRTRRAALAVDSVAVIAAPPTDSVQEGSAPEHALHTQQRLDATILGKVRVAGAGRDTYEINATDVRMALEHGERVLMEAWAAVRPMLSWNEGITFQVRSPVADGVLGPRGFRVSSPNLAERAGIETGDVVLAVNDQPVNGFGDVFRLYWQVKQDQRLSVVEVKLERQGQLMTKTYRIR